MAAIVYIDKFGLLVNDKAAAAYEVALQGSYEYSYLARGWWYDIEKISPAIPLARLFSPELICFTNSPQHDAPATFFDQ